MAAEHLTIVFRERGARAVAAKVDTIADSARVATRNLRLMQNTLFVLGGAGVLSSLGRTADTLVNMQNRLRLVTRDAQDLANVQRQLFQISNETRTSFEATATMYSRAALSIRELGIGTQEAMQFTRSLNQAVILSGVSAQEARAGIIQLSQGLASNRLSGDEMRSVLEQLPYVADVIARSMGVTRGELREFGREGRVTADVIIRAFEEMRDEIDTQFGGTVSTLSQSIAVFSNKWMEMIGRVNDTFGITTNLAALITVVGDNLQLLVTVIASVGAAWLALKLGTMVASFARWTVSIYENNMALQRGQAILINSKQAEVLRARSVLESTQAEVAAMRATLQKTQARLNEVRVMRQQKLAEVEFRVNILKSIQARQAATGATINNTNAIRQHQLAVNNLNITLAAEQRLSATIAAQRTALTASTNALAAAEVRLAGATQATTGVMAGLAAQFPAVAGAVTALGAAFNRFLALLGPIGLIASLVGLATAAFMTMRNNGTSALRLANDDLNDSFQRTTELMQGLEGMTLDQTRAARDHALATREQLNAEIDLERHRLRTNVQQLGQGYGGAMSRDLADNRILRENRGIMQEISRLEQAREENEAAIVTLTAREGTLINRNRIMQSDIVEDAIRRLQLQREAMVLNERERNFLMEVARLEMRIGRDLTDNEEERLRLAMEAMDIRKAELDVYDSINGRVEEYVRQQEALNALVAAREITQNQAENFQRNNSLVRDATGLMEDLGLQSPLAQELNTIRDHHVERLALIDEMLKAERITRDDHRNLILAAEEEYMRQQRQAEMAQHQLRITAAEETFGGLAEVAKTFAGEQSGIYRTLFAIEKAFAIARAIINTQMAVSNALASAPPPANYIQAAAAGAQGAATVANIMAQTAQGFKDGVVGLGGMGSGRSDSIPAFLSRGESVVTAAATRANAGTIAAMNAGARFDSRPQRNTKVTFEAGAFVIQGGDGVSAEEIAEQVANKLDSEFSGRFDEKLEESMRVNGPLENVARPY